MPVNTSQLLKDFDLSDLNYAYTLAYLRSKGVQLDGNKAIVDNQWYFGDIHGEPLIKTEDNGLYLFNYTGCANPTAPKAPKSKTSNSEKDSPSAKDTTPGTADKIIHKDFDPNSLSNNLHERFLDIITFLIANKHKTLPADHIKVGTAVNHHNVHWTSQLGIFETLNNAQYQALYRTYYKLGNHDPEASLVLRQNSVKNFIRENCGITTSTRNVNTQTITPGNYALPIDVNKVSVLNFESLGTNTTYQHSAQEASKNFVRMHNAHRDDISCERQRGLTCGDWSTFHPFNWGVFNVPKPSPSSEKLRELFFKLSLHNTHELLYDADPTFTDPEQEAIINRYPGKRTLAENVFASPLLEVGNTLDEEKNTTKKGKQKTKPQAKKPASLEESEKETTKEQSRPTLRRSPRLTAKNKKKAPKHTKKRKAKAKAKTKRRSKAASKKKSSVAHKSAQIPTSPHVEQSTDNAHKHGITEKSVTNVPTSALTTSSNANDTTPNTVSTTQGASSSAMPQSKNDEPNNAAVKATQNHKEKEKEEMKGTHHTPPAKQPARHWLDAPFPLSNIAFRMFIGAALAFVAYHLLAVNFSIGPLLAFVWASTTFAFGATLYAEKLLKVLFGAKEIDVRWQDKSFHPKTMNLSGGLLVIAPVKTTLDTLESKMAALLEQDNSLSNEDDLHALTRRQAKDFVTKFPDFFYPCDVDNVKEEDYVPNAKPKPLQT